MFTAVKIILTLVSHGMDMRDPVSSRPMRRFMPRLSSASLLLALMLFTALPRTLFHHCDEGLWSTNARGTAAMMHADTHCPICEAPAPICDGVATFSLDMEMVLMGTRSDVTVPSVVEITAEAPRLRGPPSLG